MWRERGLITQNERDGQLGGVGERRREKAEERMRPRGERDKA